METKRSLAAIRILEYGGLVLAIVFVALVSGCLAIGIFYK
jgi:hypothetical protein